MSIINVETHSIAYHVYIHRGVRKSMTDKQVVRWFNISFIVFFTVLILWVVFTMGGVKIPEPLLRLIGFGDICGSQKEH